MGTCIGKNNFLTRLKRLWPGAALGVDLGTANIRIYSPKRGLLSKKRTVGDAVEAASYGRYPDRRFPIRALGFPPLARRQNQRDRTLPQSSCGNAYGVYASPAGVVLTLS